MHLQPHLLLSTVILLTATATTALNIPNLTSTIARLTLTIDRLTSTIQRRATYDVTCHSGIFQNPDEDIAEVVCQAEARCQGGTQAVGSTDADGVVHFQAQCFGCPGVEEEGGITGGCVFESMLEG
ncbi:hypothetical protein DL98DRAFT_535588 [Cadophora sp. DSE1049]|nr:hypothetical protein DL98DRAFT_535588 [Cadophora sp. DSE1049]